MRLVHFIRYLALTCCLPLAAHAQSESEVPGVRELPCSSVCAQSTPAVTTDYETPKYPKELLRKNIEGYVDIRFVVGTDGAVKNMTVQNLVGSQEFATATMETLGKRKYTPATLNGVPVEQSQIARQIFNITGPNGARRKMMDAYNQSVKLVTENKIEEASEILSATQSAPELNFYERGMLANIMALIAINKKDYHAVRSIVHLPTSQFRNKVPPEALKSMMRYRMVADLNLGDVDDAIPTVFLYRKFPGVDPAEPLLKAVDEMIAKADSLPQFAVLKKIPATNGDTNYFPISRRTFSFAVTSGSLDSFNMDCRQKTISSKITPAAEWHVPKDWDRCSLRVLGTPGTTYQINLFKN